MQTIAYNCKTKSISISEPTDFLISGIRERIFEKSRTILNPSEIIRQAVDEFATNHYPDLFDHITEFVKE
jgi:hypothetical protein